MQPPIPKGMAQSSWMPKVDGYSQIFEMECEKLRCFDYSNYEVRVKLFLLNQNDSKIERFKRYWTTDVKEIFNL